GEVLTDTAAITGRVHQLVHRGTVTTREGTVLAVSAASLCLHGDTPDALDLAHAVRAALADHGIPVAPCRWPCSPAATRRCLARASSPQRCSGCTGGSAPGPTSRPPPTSSPRPARCCWTACTTSIGGPPSCQTLSTL